MSRDEWASEVGPDNTRVMTFPLVLELIPVIYLWEVNYNNIFIEIKGKT